VESFAWTRAGVSDPAGLGFHLQFAADPPISGDSTLTVPPPGFTTGIQVGHFYQFYTLNDTSPVVSPLTGHGFFLRLKARCKTYFGALSPYSITGSWNPLRLIAFFVFACSLVCVEQVSLQSRRTV